MIIREWLDREGIYYDFVQDTIEDEQKLIGYKNIGNPYEKFFVYRTEEYKKAHNDFLIPKYEKCVSEYIKNAKKYGTQDPDNASELLKQIYIELFGNVRIRDFCTKSDTMTSPQFIINKCIDYIREQEDNQLDCIYKDKKIKGTVNSSIARAACNEITNLYKSFEQYFPELKDFISVYHTIGNYSPVSEGFNSPRSDAGNKDFWDITLMYIREYYLTCCETEKKRLIKEDLLNNNKKGNWEAVKKWLDSYGLGEDGWKNFVEEMLFQDYVNEKYEVIPFWDNHNQNNLQFPKELDAMNAAIEKIICTIEKRGKRIYAICKVKYFIRAVSIKQTEKESCEYEVTQQAMDLYLKYPCYNMWRVGEPDSTGKCNLCNKEWSLTADVLTSIKSIWNGFSKNKWNGTGSKLREKILEDENYRENFPIPNHMKAFTFVYYWCGNMIPVSKSYSFAGHGGDNWAHKIETLTNFLKIKSDGTCKEWRNWVTKEWYKPNKFINDNFLMDCYDGKSVKNNVTGYCIKSLKKENMEILCNNDNKLAKELLLNHVKMIIQRSYRIYYQFSGDWNDPKEKIHKENLQEIMRYVFEEAGFSKEEVEFETFLEPF